MDTEFGAPTDPNTITKDEKLFALFAHLSVILGGIVIPFVFWLTNKDKSKFVTYHSLQALWLHLSFLCLIILWIIAFFSLAFGFIYSIPSIAHKSSGPPLFLLILMIVLYASIFLILLVYYGFGIYLAVKSYEGNLTRYPIIGKRVYKHVYGA